MTVVIAYKNSASDEAPFFNPIEANIVFDGKKNRCQLCTAKLEVETSVGQLTKQSRTSEKAENDVSDYNMNPTAKKRRSLSLKAMKIEKELKMTAL